MGSTGFFFLFDEYSKTHPYSDNEHKKVTEERVTLRLFGNWLHFFIELAVQIITQSNYPGA